LSAAFLVSGFALAIGLYALMGRFLGPRAMAPGNEATALQSAVMLASFGLATWIFGFRAGGLDARRLRWTPGGARPFMTGLALGIVPALGAMAFGVWFAGASWSLDGGTFGAWLTTLAGLLMLLLPAALAEEVIFRGVPLVLLSEAFGRATAVIGLAVIFGLAHLFNPGPTPLAIGNVALAGVFLGTVFYLPGGLWTATGAHLGWNATLAALAAPVSGLPFTIPWLDYRPGTPDWLNGGGFGPEGGLTATAVLTAGTILVARLTRKESPT
jgi:hypothetical protein